MVILMAKIFLARGYKEKQQRKKLVGQSPEETKHKFLSHVPVESHRTSASACDSGCECCLVGKLVWASESRVFIEGQLHKYPLPSVYSNSRPPAGRLVFSINYIVCTKMLGFS